MQCIRAPPTLVCRPRLFGGYNYIWQVQNGDPTRAYRSSKTPDKCRVCVLCDSDPHGAVTAWSRALTTAWSRAYCAITIMASNTKLTMDHDREIAEFRSPLR